MRQICRGSWLVLFAFMLIGCAVVESEETAVPQATPTLNSIFIASTATVTATATVEPLATVALDDEADVGGETAVVSTTIYDDQLNPDWEIQASSSAVEYSPQNSSPVHGGNRSLSITTIPAGERLFFRVKKDPSAPYLREKTLAISFWLSNESEPLEPGSMTLSVTGSNITPHWVDGDTSAGTPDDILTFSGERRYALGIEQPIPPGTWVRVDVLLDNLVYDPDRDDQRVEDSEYAYITGFYLTNTGNNTLQTIIIDDIELMVEQ